MLAFLGNGLMKFLLYFTDIYQVVFNNLLTGTIICGKKTSLTEIINKSLYYRLLATNQNRVLLPWTTVANVSLIKLQDVRESGRDIGQKFLILLMELNS